MFRIPDIRFKEVCYSHKKNLIVIKCLFESFLFLRTPGAVYKSMNYFQF